MIRELKGPQIVKEEHQLPDYKDLECQKERIDERDWDYLIVLDAMRWDVMDALVEPEVEALRTPSEGSTPDWMRKVWCREGWEDVDYLSANGMIKAMKERDNYDEYVGDYANFRDVSGLGGEIRPRVTTPDKMTEFTNREDDPPVVSHFIQPHTPFIGDFAINIAGRDIGLAEHGYDSRAPTGRVARLAYKGEISVDVYRQAYVANAHLALRWASKIANRKNNVVITSDHGEGLGPEVFDHGGPRNSCNRVVPWLELT